MMPVSECFKLYVSDADLADSSVEVKARAVRFFIAIFGDLAIDQVTAGMAKAYKKLLVKGRCGRAAANVYLSNIGPFFRWSAGQGFTQRNPFDGIGRYRTEQRCWPIFTAAELGRILSVCDCRWQVIVRLSAECSLRRGEVLNACWSDIRGDYLHIQAKNETDCTWPWRIKNYRQALVLLSDGLKDALTRLRVEVPLNQAYIVVLPRMCKRMLELQKENHLPSRLRTEPWPNFTRQWRQLLRRACVPGKRFQDLRASYATALKRGGMDIDEVSRLMRHSSIATTQQFYLRHDIAELSAKSQQLLKNFYTTNVS